ncbi:type III secretion system export apparatus subunit SctT [Gluconobacter roseus]|uniref:EscT/YscT/HrcT family type III secretion system export apparatus protein n=1 Tax=Gluconobacter roseus NBRC 3990 TaxID=1307950 RepID=A0A4Y3M7M8_9PROT|nr:type III secretion system export apparatus subunit SctT [Gluconobacter roseus]GBR47846.1 type III secretion component EscT [Gluconobacter roseus NBRC 3990]GEB03508.1 hypothetical protein GRO01_10840 [Gluconobacter roseus NBRC 3990]GLP93963.1 hypothetical protein GCM10007871_19410 [Gluconobacter roseus NBRC 3990]
MPATDALAVMQQIAPWLTSIALAMSRPAGAAIVLPAFTRMQLGGPVTGAIAFALGIPATPMIHAGLLADPRSMMALGLLGLKEMVIGVIIGFLIGLPIWGVQCAGELLDTQRSATQGQAEDPGSGNQESTTAGFFALAVTTLFVLSGGLNLLADTLLSSEMLWPPLALALAPQPGFGMVLLGLLDRLETVSLSIGAPVMLAMLLCEASVILLMRAIPKLHLYDLAPNLRNLVFILMMFGYCAWLVSYMKHDLVASRDVLGTMHQLLKP